MTDRLRLLYAADLHGDEWKFDRLLDLAVERRADAIVHGGDLFPLPGRLDPQPSFLRDFLSRHLRRCSRAGIAVILIPGNDDRWIHDAALDALCARIPGVENVSGRKAALGAYEFVGLALVPDHPFALKDRSRMDGPDFVFPAQYDVPLLSRPDGSYAVIPDWPAHARRLPTIADELARLPRPADPDRAVYVIHTPPARMRLDVAGDPGHHRCVGSDAVADFVLKVRPALTLHGHIHESPDVTGAWKTETPDTLCVQPGQARRDRQQLVAVDVSLPGRDAERLVVSR